jgi:hypothetical protein
MRRSLLLLAVSCSLACGKKAPDPTPDAGSITIDQCSSATVAKTLAECQLTLGQKLTGHIAPAGHHVWYHLSLPTLPPRALLQVTAGYDVPESPVTLQALLFQGDALKSLGSAIDKKPRGSPSPVNVVSRVDQPGDFYVLLQDDGSSADGAQKGVADFRHAYAQATPIPLSNGQGTQTGYLATTGDQDVYAVDVPGSVSSSRSVLYVGLDAPALVPDSQIRIAYTIEREGADGGAVASGQTPSPVGEQKTGTARLLTEGGRYIVTVSGYKQHVTDEDPPGDPRLKYTINVQLLPDVDANEPNDLPGQATQVDLGSVGASQTVRGRIGYVADLDWFAVRLAGSGQNTRLRYTLTFDDAQAASRRFPEVGSIDDHQLTVSSLEASTSSCEASCPSGPTQLDGCVFTTPQCIHSYRKQLVGEPSAPTGLENFQGALPVPAGAARTFHFLIEDQGNDGADDRGYTLQLSWTTEDPDDASSYHDTGATAQSVGTPLLGSYVEDPRGAAPSAQGYCSVGHAHLAEGQALNANPVIPIFASGGFQVDFDRRNDVDLFRLAIPQTTLAFPDGGSEILPLAWSSAWTVGTTPGANPGARPYDLQMTYFFCDPAQNPSCDVNGKWEVIPVAYHDGVRQSWVGSTMPGWDVSATNDAFVTRANECFCIEPRFAKGGVAYLAVSAISRASYDDAPYEVFNAFSPYPQSYGDGGGTQCPVDSSGSCHFCNQSVGLGCITIDGLNLPGATQ